LQDVGDFRPEGLLFDAGLSALTPVATKPSNFWCRMSLNAL
jgi:hypothetical protein